MKAEDILREVFEEFKFADYPYHNTYDATIKAMERYGEEVLKIAAEKAKIKRNYYPNNEGLDLQIERERFYMDEYEFFVSKESILNCLKDK